MEVTAERTVPNANGKLSIRDPVCSVRLSFSGSPFDTLRVTFYALRDYSLASELYEQHIGTLKC